MSIKLFIFIKNCIYTYMEAKMSNESIDQFILKTITNHDIFEQSQLQEHLHNQGFEVTQATISRKLKKMGIVKMNNIYKLKHEESKLKIQIQNVKIAAPNLIVLHTDPGMANAIAIQIDKNYIKNKYIEGPFKSIIGSIAGDDTILLIIDNPNHLEHIATQIQEM